MADMFELILALEVSAQVPHDVLAELRRELALDPGTHADDDPADPDADVEPPLLAQLGPAWKVGGALFSTLQPGTSGGWALAARQEIHVEEVPALQGLLDRLAPYVSSGTHPLGYLRWYEDWAPQLLVLHEQRVVALPTEHATVEAARPLTALG